MVILNLAPRSMCFFVREAVAVALGQAARIGVGRAREIFERLEQNAAAPDQEAAAVGLGWRVDSGVGRAPEILERLAQDADVSVR